MTELTNKLRKLVASLDDPRARRESGLFVAEGTKCVLDTLGAFTCRRLLATPAWLDRYGDRVGDGIDVVVSKRPDMERMSHLTTPADVIAVYEIPSVAPITAADIDGRLVLALDRLQDPGNLGTIMRVADWFGIDTVVASHDTVDLYNPKVVQATMGAISRVRVHYVDLPEWLGSLEGVSVCGTFLDGDNIFTSPLPASGIVVMGNEGRGISPEVEAWVSHRLTIPSFPHDAVTSESLNVGTATAITVAEFRRRNMI